MIYEFTPNVVDAHFNKLAIALKGVLLKRYDGTTSEGTADEFMLMQQDDDGVIAFKHRQTRNYVYLRGGYKLYVPMTGNPFNRGEF